MICANPISKESAQKIAEEFMTQKAASRGVKRAARMQAVKALQWNVQTSDASLYLFNASDGNGFVIVSGDDRTEPILGYSDTGTIDTENMPHNMRSWLQHYADEIELIRQYNLSSRSQSIANCGEAITSTLNCRWNQNPLYNDQCPLVSVYSNPECTQLYEYLPNVPAEPMLSVTGCVATALAQVLYQWKAVSATTAEIPARVDYVWQDMITDSDAGTVGTPIWLKFSDQAIPAGTPIDWGNMLDDYYQRDAEGYVTGFVGTEEQRSAVATLMHICGAGTGMNYGVGFGTGSGVGGEQAVIAASKYLGFTNASMCYQELYAYQDWLQMLYDELSTARAVYFGGQSSNGGHAFVIDGYDSEDVFHVNWGWYGMSDGYYRISLLNPPTQGTGGAFVNDGFRMGQMFARGIYPDAPAFEPEQYVTLCVASDESDITASEGIFTLPPIFLRTASAIAMEAIVKIGLTIEGNGHTETLDCIMNDYSTFHFLDGFAGPVADITISSDMLTDGEYYCYPSYRTPESDSWKPCKDYQNHCLKLTINGNVMKVENVLPYKLTYLSSDQKTTYEAGEAIEFTAKVKVEKGSIHERIYCEYVPLADDGEALGKQGCGEENYYAFEDDVVELEYNIPNGLPAGKYKIQYGTSSYTEDFCTIEVKDKPTSIQSIVDITHSVNIPAYNLQGQRISDSYKGITIRNGKKIINR